MLLNKLEDKNNILQLLLNNSSLSIFFCGIGGIGMSALATMAKALGYTVYGSNNIENENTKRLKQEGIVIYIGHKKENIGDCVIFVYTSAIDENNEEMQEAINRNCFLINRGEMLSCLSENYFNIVIAGSHGKTTTTAMVNHIINEAGSDSTVLAGGIINNYKSNIKLGSNKILVLESDESDGTFISLKTNIGIITNIDLEHMDYYVTRENLLKYFLNFAQKAASESGLVVCLDSELTRELFTIIKKDKTKKVTTYSKDKSLNADFYPDNFRYSCEGVLFDLFYKDPQKALGEYSILKDCYLNMYGHHNVLNAIAAIIVAKILGYKVDNVKNNLSNFTGVEKRFTIIGKIFNNKINCALTIIDDYAHNPEKISSAIDSCKHFIKHSKDANDKKLFVVFEPHRYTRVKNSIESFMKAFKLADYVFVLDIFAASEKVIDGITQDYIVDMIKKEEGSSKYIIKCSNKNIETEITQVIKKDNIQNAVILFVGAGDSSKIAKNLFSTLSV